jgi:hypothetical protein
LARVLDQRDRHHPWKGVDIVTSTATADYAAELTEALELRGVPSTMIRDIVAEVVSHAAESGADPRAEFGEPAAYAQRYASDFRIGRFWLLIAGTVALTVGGTLMLLSGVFGLQNPGYTLWELTPWTRVAIGAAALIAFVGVLLVAGVRSERRTRSWRMRRD